MSSSKIKAGFKSFSSKFPKAIFPLMVDDKLVMTSSRKNKPLSEDHIFRFLLEEEEPLDEFTEFVACFRLPDTKTFHAFVVWRGGLLTYQYWLMVYDMKGETTAKFPIAGTNLEGEWLRIRTANIRSSWELEIFEGSYPSNTQNLNPKNLAPAGILKLDPTSGDPIYDPSVQEKPSDPTEL